jgi:hypothetical protein|tara:strand:- start:246 stop:890 length:645 start_codon:yes stop_codon:yes gene_type:complete
MNNPKAKPRMSSKEKADLKTLLKVQALKENEKKKAKTIKKVSPKKTPPKKTPAKKIVKKEKKVKVVKEVKEKKLSKCKFIDMLILEGGHTAIEIAEFAVKEYPASLLEPTLRTVRVRPSHLRARGELNGGLPAFRDSKPHTGKIAAIRGLLDGSKSVEEIAVLIINDHGGELKSTRNMIRTTCYMGKKKGLELSYKLIKISKADKVSGLTSKVI